MRNVAFRKLTTMTVIALIMETGTYDSKFGERVARKLGLQFTDMRAFELEIAERCDNNDCNVHRLVDGEGSVVQFWDLTSRQLSIRIKEQTLQTTAQGNTLILGWSAASILARIHHVVRVRVVAPIKYRERNVMKQLAYNDVRTARWEVESSDALISRFVSRTTGADWTDSSLYDLVVNARTISAATCIELISGLALTKQVRETSSSRKMLTAELDRLRAQDGAADQDEVRAAMRVTNLVSPMRQNRALTTSTSL
jgi:cytidylate kinase